MSLIPLGVLAASAAPAAAGDFALLQTYDVSTPVTSVTFANLNTLAAGYKHLQIRATMRSTVAGNEDFYYVQFNGDTGSNYRHHYLVGTGSVVVSGDDTSSYPSGCMVYFGMTGAGITANSFGASVVDILDPFISTKNTTIRTLNGMAGSYNRIGLMSGLWNNTASVTQIRVAAIFGSFAQNTRISLYGIRG